MPFVVFATDETTDSRSRNTRRRTSRAPRRVRPSRDRRRRARATSQRLRVVAKRARHLFEVVGVAGVEVRPLASRPPPGWDWPAGGTGHGIRLVAPRRTGQHPVLPRHLPLDAGRRIENRVVGIRAARAVAARFDPREKGLRDSLTAMARGLCLALAFLCIIHSVIHSSVSITWSRLLCLRRSRCWRATR